MYACYVINSIDVYNTCEKFMALVFFLCAQIRVIKHFISLIGKKINTVSSTRLFVIHIVITTILLTV